LKRGYGITLRACYPVLLTMIHHRSLNVAGYGVKAIRNYAVIVVMTIVSLIGPPAGWLRRNMS
nr:hypothetical protein [Tanacetum cinerariifolium]